MRMTLTCCNDTHGYDWRHAALFVHDAAGRELTLVRWQMSEDGPGAADAEWAEV